ncbi:heme-dependent oxidative N-demethylase family protein [Pseudooceanicola algae]|uniref:DUF3445 domain-containing protein n=1 Tax=Pseudooceanicola algae TaxID=1537215 RepID=A0A418SC51_9RHOB|nr:DUF3445 domain-containing protein [Pseudooceanicola algae]QPM89955.1 hypothetical protein PSAL_011860 [Pseudooceanicola algae]
MEPITQSALPYKVPERLPGTAPLDPANWLLVDDAFAGQMALRDHLIATRPGDVLALDPEARPVAEELYDTVLEVLRAHDDYAVNAESVTRPDGVTVPLDRAVPMATLGRLVQEDFCIMEKRDGAEEHVLTGAVLCFPSQWTLAEKFMRPMRSIHIPVKEYDDGLARRVQRLLDGVQVGRPLWRANFLGNRAPELFNPASEYLPRDARYDREAPFHRSERQTILRLPQTRVVIFGIHTFVVPA